MAREKSPVWDHDLRAPKLKLQEVLGLSRGLHVLSMMYKTGYELMLHSLTRFPDRLRGVVSPSPDITDGELEILTRAGVVGARFAYRVSPDIDDRMVARAHEQGWSMHYLVPGGEQADRWRAQMLGSPGQFVIEHMGLPPPAKGVDSPEFRFVLDALDTGRGWVKLSPRFTAEQDFPFADTEPFIRRVVEQAPDRLLWGSDWPHPQYFKPMPNDADLVDMMLHWAPTEELRRRIFVENPEVLFGFPPVAGA